MMETSKLMKFSSSGVIIKQLCPCAQVECFILFYLNMPARKWWRPSLFTTWEFGGVEPLGGRAGGVFMVYFWPQQQKRRSC